MLCSVRDAVAIVFVVQHLFDEAQIIADNVGPPVTRQQWQYLYRLGLDVRNSLSNVSCVLPGRIACFHRIDVASQIDR